MSIESQIPSQEINIKDLSLSSPEDDRPFDYNKLIDAESIISIQQALRSYFNSESREHDEADAENLYEMDAMMKIINPDKTLKLSEGMWENLKQDTETFKHNILDLLVILSSAKVLSAEKYKELDVSEDDISKEFGLYLNRAFRGSAANKDLGVWDVCKTLWHYKIIFPKISNAALTEPEWQTCFNLAQESRQADDGGSFLVYAIVLKIFRPDLFAQLKLTGQDWASIKTYFEEEAEQRHWPELAVYMAKAKMLAADKIKFTDHGPEAVYDDDTTIETAIPSLPKIKKF